MNRSTCTQALVLNLKPLGENNSSVTLLTPEHGILYATLYGGPKSKMRSLVAQWNSGNIWLYENPEKNQIKISDFEVKHYHNTFSENLFKLYAASLAAEIAIKTRCAGSNQQVFDLISGFFDGMELCNEEQSRLGLLRFLWRYLGFLGIQPESHCCSSCEKSFLDSQFAPNDISYYNSIDNNFVCSECFNEYSQQDDTSRVMKLDTSVVQYLTAISVLPPSEARRLHINKEGYEQMKQIIFFLIQNGIDQKLNSIETGMGIL